MEHARKKACFIKRSSAIYKSFRSKRAQGKGGKVKVIIQLNSQFKAVVQNHLDWKYAVEFYMQCLLGDIFWKRINDVICLQKESQLWKQLIVKMQGTGERKAK